MTYRNSFLDKLSAHDSLWEKLRKRRNPFEEQPPVSAQAEFPTGMPPDQTPPDQETPQSLWERMGKQLSDTLNVIQVGTPEAKVAKEEIERRIEQNTQRWQEQAPERMKLIPGGTEFASFLETPAPEWLPKFSPMGSPIQTVGDIPKLLTEMPVLAEVGGIGKLGGMTPKGAVGKGIPKPAETIFEKIIKGEKLTLAEEQFRVKNAEIIEDMLKAKTKVVPEGKLPIPEPGMPEAGLQPEMFGKAPTEVRPKGKGVLTQTEMEDYMKLRQAQEAAGVAPETGKVFTPKEQAAYDAEQALAYKQVELETLRETLANDPVANRTFQMGTKIVGKGETRKVIPNNVGLESLISIREGDFPEYLTVKQAQAIKPHTDWTAYTQKGTKNYNRVPTDAVLDDIASELGFTGTSAVEDLGNRVMQIRKERAQIRKIEPVTGRIPKVPGEVPTVKVETPVVEAPTPKIEQPITKPVGGEPPIVPPKKPPTAVAAMPEPTPDEIVALTKIPGSPKLTQRQTDYTLQRFGEIIVSPESKNVRELTIELRKNALGKRVGALQDRAEKLINEGKSPEVAISQATKETMSGKLPEVTYDIFDDLTEEMRDVLFSKVYHTLKDEPLEMISTAEALTNALLGKSIPSVAGIKGGSAYTRLVRVFGDNPEVMKVIEQASTKEKPLKDVVEGIFRDYVEGGRAPIPLDPEINRYLETLKGKPEIGMQQTIGLEPGTAKEMFTYKPTGRLGFEEQAVTREFYEDYKTLKEWLSTNLPEDLRSPAQKVIDLQMLKLETQFPDIVKGVTSKYTISESGVLRQYPERPLFPDDITTLREFLERRLPPELRTPAEKELERQLFKLETEYPTAATGVISKYEAPIKEALKEMPMIPMAQKNIIVRALKEIGLSAIDIGNFLRANKASFDFSFWRQQAPLIFNNKKAFLQANIDGWRAIFNPKVAEDAWVKITRDPLFAIYDKLGLDFLRPPMLPKNAAQWRGVEEFGYLTGARPIPRFTEKLPWVKLSQRSFVTAINSHNMRIFKQFYQGQLKILEKVAVGKIKIKPNEVFSVEKNLEDFGKMLQDMTGRASLGKVSPIAPALSSMFFAPRLNLGRLLTPRHLWSGNPYVRKEAWKNLVSFVGVTGGVIVLGKQLGLWDVEFDPRSSDYGKIRIGNTRIDPWGGYQQYVVFLARLITRTGLSSQTGEEYAVDPWQASTSFARGKAAPMASVASEFWTGKTFIGDKVDVKNPKQWIDRVSPMAAMDIYEAFMSDPLTGMGVTIPAVLGAGVQTYGGEGVQDIQSK